jgi:hypothetical protein
VTVPAVELDHDSEVPPKEIDLIAADPSIGLEPGNASAAKEAQHRALARRLRSLRATREIEHATELCHATFPLVALQLSPELGLGRESPVLRLGDDALKLLVVE